MMASLTYLLTYLLTAWKQEMLAHLKIQRSICPSNTIHPLIATLCFISHMPFEYITNTISIVQYPTNAMLHISSWLQGWRMDGMGRMLCDLRWWKQEENKGGRPTTRERRKWVPKSGGNRPVQYYIALPRCSLTIWPFDFHHINISISISISQQSADIIYLKSMSSAYVI